MITNNEKPEWENLRKNKCPKCSRDYASSLVAGKPGYIVCKCGFEITEQKYQEIVSDRTSREIDRRNREPRDEEMGAIGMQIATSFLDQE